MVYVTSPLAVGVFVIFVPSCSASAGGSGARAKSSGGYFAAHGQIHWFVNGVAFAGDYLSAASFLGICGMIAFYGYDGFLYSIGYLAGWVVALFVIAEPLKRLGKFTFADALDSQFNSRGIKLAAAISTLVVSVFYLIPQMVGAGVLVKPLLGFPHAAGVVIVGAVVILIVVTAGMVSTTWVQFIKGVAAGRLLHAADRTDPAPRVRGAVAASPVTPIAAAEASQGGRRSSRTPTGRHQLAARPGTVGRRPDIPPAAGRPRPADAGGHHGNRRHVRQRPAAGPRGRANRTCRPSAQWWPCRRRRQGDRSTGPLGPLEFLRTFNESTVVIWSPERRVLPTAGSPRSTRQSAQPGADVLRPGASPTFAGIRGTTLFDKLNFLSLMLALFCGTASLPHISSATTR